MTDQPHASSPAVPVRPTARPATGSVAGSVAQLIDGATERALRDPGRVVRALLVDLDNLGMPAAGYARAHLEAVIFAVEATVSGPVDVMVAFGRDCSFAAYQLACVDLGVEVFEAPAVPDGADLELLKVAAALAEAGVREFFVASGDHAFTRLPGSVHVVVPVGRQLSKRLESAADGVCWVEVPRPPRSRASASRARRRAAARRTSADG